MRLDLIEVQELTLRRMKLDRWYTLDDLCCGNSTIGGVGTQESYNNSSY